MMIVFTEGSIRALGKGLEASNRKKNKQTRLFQSITRHLKNQNCPFYLVFELKQKDFIDSTKLGFGDIANQDDFHIFAVLL
jgi:hypothetical protein